MSSVSNDMLDDLKAYRNNINAMTRYDNYLFIFFRNLLIINLVFFTTTSLLNVCVALLYKNVEKIGQVATFHDYFSGCNALLKFIVTSVFYYLSVKKTKNKDNNFILKIWFFTYVMLEVFKIVIMDAIKYSAFDNVNSRDFSIFIRNKPLIFIGFSSIILSVVFYLTGILLNIKLVSRMSFIYPAVAVLIILIRPLEIDINNRFTMTVNISELLYDIQYILWLAVLVKKCKTCSDSGKYYDLDVSKWQF